MLLTFDNKTPDASGLKLEVFVAGIPIAHLHCIETPGGLKWYAAMINGPTGNAKIGREAALADVAAWGTGNAPGYVMEGLPREGNASFYAWQPAPVKLSFWQRIKAVFA